MSGRIVKHSSKTQDAREGRGGWGCVACVGGGATGFASRSDRRRSAPGTLGWYRNGASERKAMMDPNVTVTLLNAGEFLGLI